MVLIIWFSQGNIGKKYKMPPVLRDRSITGREAGFAFSHFTVTFRKELRVRVHTCLDNRIYSHEQQTMTHTWACVIMGFVN